MRSDPFCALKNASVYLLQYSRRSALRNLITNLRIFHSIMQQDRYPTQLLEWVIDVEQLIWAWFSMDLSSFRCMADSLCWQHQSGCSWRSIVIDFRPGCNNHRDCGFGGYCYGLVVFFVAWSYIWAGIIMMDYEKLRVVVLNTYRFKKSKD